MQSRKCTLIALSSFFPKVHSLHPGLLSFLWFLQLQTLISVLLLDDIPFLIPFCHSSFVQEMVWKEGNIFMGLCNLVRTAQTLPPRLVLSLISVALSFDTIAASNSHFKTSKIHNCDFRDKIKHTMSSFLLFHSHAQELRTTAAVNVAHKTLLFDIKDH